MHSFNCLPSFFFFLPFVLGGFTRTDFPPQQPSAHNGERSQVTHPYAEPFENRRSISNASSHIQTTAIWGGGNNLPDPQKSKSSFQLTQHQGGSTPGVPCTSIPLLPPRPLFSSFVDNTVCVKARVEERWRERRRERGGVCGRGWHEGGWGGVLWREMRLRALLSSERWRERESERERGGERR